MQLGQSLIALRLLPPFWRFYADPPYMYLFNSLSLATGKAPKHVDHPGTSLQWLMAGIEHVTFSISGSEESLAGDIAWNPEKYLQVTGVVLAVLFAASASFLAFQLLRYLGGLPSVVASLSILAASGLTVPWIVVATPEALVASCTLTALGILVPSMVSTNHQPTAARLIAVGILMAIGVTAKIVMLPLFVALAFILSLRKLLAAFGVFVLATAVILIPVYASLPRMFGWFVNLSRSSGRYGGESPASVSSNIIAGLSTVSQEYFLTWIVLAATIALLVFAWVRQRQAFTVTLGLPAVGLTLAVFANLVFSFKETTDRDFILLVGLIPVLAALVVATTRCMARTGQLPRFLASEFVGGMLITALILVVLVQTWGSFQEIKKFEESSAREAAVLEDASNYDGVVVHSFLAQNEFFALMLGSEWAHHPYSDKVLQRFPDNLYFNYWWSTVFGIRSDGTVGYLNCDDLSPLIKERGLLFVLPGDFSDQPDLETPQSITLGDGSVLSFDSGSVRLFDDRLSAIPIVNCATS